MFARHGVKVVFFGRFVSVLRTYAAFIAGTAMRWRFLARNATGGIVWAASVRSAYLAGNTLKRAGTVNVILIGWPWPSWSASSWWSAARRSCWPTRPRPRIRGRWTSGRTTAIAIMTATAAGTCPRPRGRVTPALAKRA